MVNKKILLLVLLIVINVFLIGSLLTSKTFKGSKQKGKPSATLAAAIKLDVKPSVSVPCYFDKDCQKNGQSGVCENANTPEAACVYKEDETIKLLVIVPEACRTCNTETFITKLKEVFPAIAVETLMAKDEKAAPLIELLKINMLPAYLISKTVEKDKNFKEIESYLIPSGQWYYIRPGVAGVSYFLHREIKPSQIDVFVSLLSKDAPRFLAFIDQLNKQVQGKVNIQFHSIGFEDSLNAAVVSPYGIRDIEEEKILGCIEKMYPEKRFEYLTCRSIGVESLWWEDCLKATPVDVEKVRSCARSLEGQKIFDEKIKLSKDLKIYNPGLLLLDNVEIFGISPETKIEEVLKILNLSNE